MCPTNCRVVCGSGKAPIIPLGNGGGVIALAALAICLGTKSTIVYLL